LDTTGLEVFFFSHESYNVSILDYVRQYPVEFAQLVYRNLWRFVTYLVSDRLLPSFLVPILALGLFIVPWVKLRAKRELVWLSSAMPLLGFLLFFIQDRYIATLLPTLVVWTAHGLFVWGKWIVDSVSNLRAAGGSVEPHQGASEPSWRKLLWAMPLVLVLAFFVYQMPGTLRTTSSGSFRYAHKDMGLWMKDRVSRDTIIMSRYPAVAFHADALWVPTPNASIAEVLRYARHKGADYCVVDEREVVSLRPQFDILLDEDTLPEGFRWVRADTSEAETLVLLKVES
jgi:hypothetical protein